MSQATAAQTGIGAQIPQPGTWEIDPAHSSIAFWARHLVVAKVRGHFGSFAGVIHVAENPAESWAEATIDAATIDTANETRDAHLRSPDFLHVERFPALRFRSTGLGRTGESSFRLDGELTIRDVTRPVALDVAYEGLTPDPWGNTRAVFYATTEIDREEFGITWNQALESGGVLVGRTVRIELEIEAVRVA
jgi:polyisoprenoid-binding protein YceI